MWYSFRNWLAPSGVEYARLRFKFRVVRKTSYYMWKIFFPLCILFLLSVVILAFPIEDYENRMNLGATMFLSSMAFLYVVGDSIPRVAYLTKMDYCIMAELFTQIVVVFVSVFFQVWLPEGAAESEDEKTMMQYDLCRWCNMTTAFVVTGLFIAVNAIVVGLGQYKRLESFKHPPHQQAKQDSDAEDEYDEEVFNRVRHEAARGF